jgi:hypothetical protein
MYHKIITHYESTHADPPKLSLTVGGSAGKSAELFKVFLCSGPNSLSLSALNASSSHLEILKVERARIFDDEGLIETGPRWMVAALNA